MDSDTVVKLVGFQGFQQAYWDVVQLLTPLCMKTILQKNSSLF